MNRNLILIPSLLLLQIPTFPIQAASPSIAKNSICNIQIEDEIDGIYSTQELQALANKITVKVIGDNNGGSGTLIGKQGNNYLVLTNSHVVRGTNSIKLQTADGKTYSAEIIPQNNFKNSDISLLKFQSNQSYCLPEISTATPDITTNILASGFSGSTGKITFSSGEVKKTSKLKEGYEIGYSSNIEQGMSGGAILSTQGQLVGINGRSSYPIINSGYVYQNGKLPSETEIKEMRKLSWGIPISTVLARVDRNVLTAYELPLPKVGVVIPQPVLPEWLAQIEEKAKQFTVRIDNGNNNGSGIIIAKEGNNYTVLTSAHVMCERDNATQPCGGFNYEILAPHGNKYPVGKSSIKIEEGVDLAIVKFKSSEDYQIATLANYNPNNRDFIFTAGFPKLKHNSPWRFTTGRIFEKEIGLLQSTQSDFQTHDSLRLKSASSLTGGYELVYTSITYGGMSGGPVLDSQGRVIGIHGLADAQRDEKIESGSGKVQIGYSLGIPVSTFLALNSRLGVKPQKLENTRTPQLNTEKKDSIEKAILSVSVPGENATASQWLERGNQLWRLRRFQEAVKAFDEAISQKPPFIYLAYYGKSLALSADKKYIEAVAALEQTLEVKDNFVPALNSLSTVYRELGQPEKALLAINKAIELQPQNPNLYNEKHQVLRDLKEYKQAETAINKAIELAPRAAFYYNRAHIYGDQKKWDLALADYNKAIQINPDFAQAYINRGFVYHEQKKWDLALADYNKAIQINPEFAQAYNNRANLYSEQKKWDVALADYNKAIQINPKGAYIYFNRATNIYNNQKKWNLALADYNQAIDINPKYAAAYNNRANLYTEQKKWDLALADYNKAIQIAPNNIKHYFGRSILYTDQKKWELALADYNKIIQINPDHAFAYSSRADIYRIQQKWDLALADYNKAIDINPEDGIAFSQRGIIYLMIGNRQKAIKDLQKAAQISKFQNNTKLYQVVINLLNKIQK